MLQVRDNEITPRKCSGVTAQLCTLEGALVSSIQDSFMLFLSYAAKAKAETAPATVTGRAFGIRPALMRLLIAQVFSRALAAIIPLTSAQRHLNSSRPLAEVMCAAVGQRSNETRAA